MSKKTSYKNDIVVEYLTDYPELPTLTIAKLLHKNNPLDFKTVENARSIVRSLRHETSCKNDITSIDCTDFKRTDEQKKEARAYSKIPESDYSKVEDFIIPSGNNRILILNDIHLPYHDIKALQLAIDFGKKRNVNAVYLNGDTLDMYQASRFIKDRRLRDLHGELEMGRNFLTYLKEQLNCPIYYKIGNHEERLENYLKQNAPELFGIPDFQLENLLRFGENGVNLVKSKQMTYAGKLAILHGHEFGHSVFSPVNAARGLYMRTKESSAIGHHHQTSEHSEKSLSGEVVTTWSIGCLCGLQPEYYPFNKWNHGFAYIEVDKNKDYNFDNIRIINGKIV